MTDKTTAKIAPRKGESDTGKLPRSIGDWIKLAKGNPWVLALVALGGGTGTQEALAQMGQRVEWWWVAIAVAGYGVLQYFADSSRRQEQMQRDIAEFKTEVLSALRVGSEKFENLEGEVKSLNGWRKEMQAGQSGRKRRGGSEGSLRTT